MGRLKLALIIIGGVLLYFGYQEKRLAQVAKKAPQTIACADLAANGPGDNAHIVLTNYELAPNFVYEAEGKGNSWKRVFIPAVPKRGLLAVLRDEKIANPKVIIESRKVRNEAELPNLAKELQGMVINEIESLSGEQKKLLAESYPGADLNHCWIIEHGRKPAGGGFITGLLGGGIALVVAGIGLLLAGRRG
jgi:hypothetical protein